MIMSNKILEAYKSELIGKRFLYTSKYGGETIGEIADVVSSHASTYDRETCAIIAEYIRKKREEIGKPPFIGDLKIGTKTYIGPKEVSDAKKNSKYVGTRTKYEIKSTNGVAYELSDIFILKD
jgi:hypothetical protein